MANQVYDPETEDNPLTPDRSGPGAYDNPTAPGRASYNRAIPGRDDLRKAEDGASSPYNPSGDTAGNEDGGATSQTGGSNTGTAAGGAESPEGLRDSENNAENLYNNSAGSDQASRWDRSKNFAKKNRRPAAVALVIGGGGITSMIIMLMTLMPLKIEHIVQNLQDRFLSSLTGAVEGQSRYILKNYIVEHVIPDYKNCGTTITTKCKVRIVGGAKNPVTNTYRAWSKARLENQLAKKGIVIEMDTAARRTTIKFPGGPRNGIDIGENGQKLDEVFNRRDIRGVQDSVMAEYEKSTRWKQMMMRYKVGKYIERNYGIKRFIFFNGTRQSIHGTIGQQKRAAKLMLAERVLKPFSETQYIAFTCVMDPNCEPQKVEADGENRPTSETEREMRTTLEANAATYGNANMEELRANYDDMKRRGFQRYLSDRLFAKFLGQTAAERVTDKIPLLGWINLAADVVHGIETAGPKVKKLRYLPVAASAAALFWEYRSYADEIHTGKVKPAVVGSMVDSLGPGVEDPDDPLAGGTAGAEQSPLYNELMQGGADARAASPASLISAFLPARASAAEEKPSADAGGNSCDSNKAPPAGDICSEEKLGMGIGVLSSITEWLRTDGASLILLKDAWRNSIGAVFRAVDSAIGFILSPGLRGTQQIYDRYCSVSEFQDDHATIGIGPIRIGLPKVPGPPGAGAYCAVRSVAEEAIPKIKEAVTEKLLNNPFSSNMGGGRTFTMMAAGAKVTGDDSCGQIGCQQIDKKTAAAIIKEEQAKARDKFERQPLMARMFDKTTPYSLVSKVAMATPFDAKSSARSSFANLISNPATVFAGGLGSIFSSRVSAAEEIDPDPFNTGNVGFPVEKIPPDPEKYWDEHNCGDTSENGPIAQWQKKAADAANSGDVNPNTGMPVYKEVEPCLLIKYATGVGGGKFDTSLLGEDAPESDDSSDTVAGDVSGDAQELAQELLDAGNLSDLGNGYMDQIKAIADGDFSCNVNPDILKMLVGVTVEDGHKVVMSSLNRQCTAQSGVGAGTNSYHYRNGGGHAVDIAMFDGVSFSDYSAVPEATLKLLKSASKYLPKKTGYGQVESCTSRFKIPEGGYAVPDNCDHQHIEVPEKKAKR